MHLRPIPASLAPLLVGPALVAQPARQPEYRLKAKFLAFVGQAATRADGTPLVKSEEPFTIGIFGRNPFEGFLTEATDRKTIGGRPVRITFPRTPGEVQVCHLLFVSPSEADRCEEVLGWVQGLPVITVGDRPEFLGRGGMVAFLPAGDRLEIWVDLAAVKASGLAFDPSFLGLVRIRKSVGKG